MEVGVGLFAHIHADFLPSENSGDSLLCAFKDYLCHLSAEPY